MAALQGEMEALRLSRMRHNAQAIAAHLRPDLTTEDAAVILWTYSSPELYELLVIKQKWPLQRYGEFVSDALAAALLYKEEVHSADGHRMPENVVRVPLTFDC
jgi:hypothetical protein